MPNVELKPPKTEPSSGFSIGLWFVQVLLFLLFAGTGFWKLTTPVTALAAKFPWMGEVSPSFLRMTAIADLLGGVGVLLPALTRIQPRLTPLAAIGCILLQICAIGFHVFRGEAARTPFNFVLVALAAFVLWGRGWKAPVRPRG
jgi:hypothetical protein